MKILFFNYEYPPLGAGAANATECILREFVKMPELELDLVTSSIDEKYHLVKLGEKIRIHRLPIGKNAEKLHFQSQKDLLVYLWRAYDFSRKLVRDARKNNKPYDLTHSFFTVPCGFLSMLLKFEFKLPYIISLRGSDVPYYSDRFTFLYKLITPLIKFIWSRSAQVISNSEGLRELAFRSSSQQKIEIIYNGIDIKQFFPKSGSEVGDRFILTSGASRITDRKGLDYLIEAVAKLAPKYPQIYLKLMGDGNARERLEQFVKDSKLEKNVVLLGRIPHEIVLPYYQEASLFVFPSLNEGMSNAMLEALATGLPLISTNTGGASELVIDGENGFIIKFKDSQDIADKIEKLILDEELRKKMALASRALAEKMSWESVAQKYFEVYKQVGKNK
ncbi:MAG: glycosyltransferase family 4 protein [Candidatus Moraniibacteriota bacterium]